MPRPARILALLLVVVTLVAGCSSSSSSGSSSGGVRCLDRGSGGQGSLRSSEEPDRPLFFLFCVQSP
ncbi:MAG TPA: hypothetical protein VL948_18180 [Verrucomicrobiae bacterium]|jgi:hypothetical protein|nr:hypothetical protein [Verrucomicrobiae bacterium]